MSPTEEQQLIIDIDSLKTMVEERCLERGRSPSDAVMMLLTAAAQEWRETVIGPEDTRLLHAILDSALEAAGHWWQLEDTGRMQ